MAALTIKDSAARVKLVEADLAAAAVAFRGRRIDGAAAAAFAAAGLERPRGGVTAAVVVAADDVETGFVATAGAGLESPVVSGHFDCASLLV